MLPAEWITGRCMSQLSVVYCAHRNEYDFSIPFTVPLGGVRRSAHAHRQLQRCVQFGNHISTGGRRVMNLSSASGTVQSASCCAQPRLSSQIPSVRWRIERAFPHN